VRGGDEHRERASLGGSAVASTIGFLADQRWRFRSIEGAMRPTA
jgi:hypothetical protein